MTSATPRTGTAGWGVCLITQRSLFSDVEELFERLAVAVAGGVSMVVIREKDLDAADLCRFTRRVREVVARVAGPAPAVLVHRRLDVAVAAGASGVHLPASGLDPADVRQQAPAPFLVGVSTHRVEEIMTAETRDSDHVFFGPVFPTASHPGHPGVGVEMLRHAATTTRLPVWGIGGIEPGNVQTLAALPLAGVAVIRAVWTAADPAEAVRCLAGAATT